MYSLYTHDCMSTSESNIIGKFTDDTAIVGLISHKKKEAYRTEVIQRDGAGRITSY